MSPESYLFIAKLLKIVIIVLSVVAAGLFCVPFYLSTKESRIRKKKLKQLYASRKSLDDDEFYKRFYESRNVPRDIVEKVRKILAEDFYLLDVSRILPQDDFTGNLSILWGEWSGLDGLEAVEVVERFEKEFDITISDSEGAAMKTIEDIILIIWWKILHDDKASRVA
ncbi:MAG: hypothetical protein DMF74_20590 [Acidobacteria bacterium]|nr:MAG: hypothetical protein DMF74_20590 [Acidobacteriota bacterium]